MLLALGALVSLAQTCAPGVAPETLLSVAVAESGLDPLAVAVNGPHRLVFHPATAAEAQAVAARWIAAGRSVDLGLGQINSRNLAPLGLSLAGVFDACRNLAASATVLADGYRRAAPVLGAEQAGLATALSYYNTGDAMRGRRNGYVDRVWRAAADVAPAVRSGAPASPRSNLARWDVAPHPASLVVF
jgi:type IV secretion system protein VirB1